MSPERLSRCALPVSLAIATLIAFVLLLASGGCAEPVPGPDQLDRRMAAEQIQSFSDYVGFEAHFGVAGMTLTMRGGELCGPEVLLVLPADAVKLARAAGFTSLSCIGEHGETALVAISE